MEVPVVASPLAADGLRTDGGARPCPWRSGAPAKRSPTASSNVSGRPAPAAFRIATAARTSRALRLGGERAAGWKAHCGGSGPGETRLPWRVRPRGADARARRALTGRARPPSRAGSSRSCDPSVKYLYMGVSVGLVESRPTDHAPRRGVEAPPGRRGGHPRAACQGGGIRAACPCRCAEACAAVGEGDAAAREPSRARSGTGSTSPGRTAGRESSSSSTATSSPTTTPTTSTGDRGSRRAGASTATCWRRRIRSPISSSISTPRRTCCWRARARGRPSSSSSAATTTSRCGEVTPDFAVVDATLPLEDVVARVVTLIRERDSCVTTVLVTDAGRGSAISIIRSLGRRGMSVVAADADPSSAGFSSRTWRRRSSIQRPSAPRRKWSGRPARGSPRPSRRPDRSGNGRARAATLEGP